MAEVDPVEVPHRDHRTRERLLQCRAPLDEPQCYAPAVRMLSRQFLASYLTLYATILFVTTLVIVALEMMLEFDNVSAQGPGRLGGRELLPASRPLLLSPVSGPRHLFRGGVLRGRDSRPAAHEVIAMKAGGISIHRVAIPRARSLRSPLGCVACSSTRRSSWTPRSVSAASRAARRPTCIPVRRIVLVPQGRPPLQRAGGGRRRRGRSRAYASTSATGPAGCVRSIVAETGPHLRGQPLAPRTTP